MQPSSTILIIADDLTGAADSAARCRAAGLPASIAVTPPEPPLPTGALAVNTDSRHLTPAAAAAQVRAVCAPLAQTTALRAALWYKKIDSTLRGNIGAELAALVELCAAPAAVVCPAFPAQGRGLEHGRLVYASSDSTRLHLPSLLAQQSGQPTALLDLDDVRLGPEGLAQRMRAALDQGITLLVVDAMDDTDLTTLIDAAEMALPGMLFCGSAGLIGALAARHAPALPATGAPDTDAVATPFARALIAVGSGSAMAHAQIRALISAVTDAHVAVIGGEDACPETEQTPAASAPVTLVHLPVPAPDAVLDGADARRLAAQLAESLTGLIRATSPDLLILVGGDTAVSVLTQLGVTRLHVVAELLPGIPLTRAVLAAGPPLHVVLKAGNHGRPHTLVELVSTLLARTWC